MGGEYRAVFDYASIIVRSFFCLFVHLFQRVAVRVMSQEQASKRTGEKQTDNFLNCLRDVMYRYFTVAATLYRR